MNADDLVELQDEIARRGNVAILASQSYSPTPPRLSKVTVDVYGQDDLTIYLARSQDVAAIRVRPNPAPANGYFLDSNTSPVLEFSRCYCADELIRRGRFWVSTGYWDEGGKWVRPNREFLSWADSWIRLIRRHFARLDGGDYIGAHAAAWAAAPGHQLEAA